MKRRLKIILSTLASLLLLGIVTLVTIPFVVDINNFKAQIQTAVQENTGRTLTIDGDIELSIFPWLGITTGKITLNNPEYFSTQPFAQISQSQIKVKLWPLLFKQLEISEIVLKGLSLNLSKNPQGVTNWADLVALIEDRSNGSKNPLKLLEIAGISIKDAQVNWNDQQTGKKISIKDFNLNTDKLIFNQPIEMTFDFTAHHAELAVTETVDFSGALTMTEQLDIFSLKQIKLQTQTEAAFIPMGKLLASVSGDARFDLKQQILKFTPLQIKTGEVSISAPKLTAWLQTPFKIEGTIHIPTLNAAKFIQQYTQIKLPAMADERALTWLAADFQFQANPHHAKLQNIEIQLDETIIKGSGQINNFAAPTFNFTLGLDKVNLDRYLPAPAQEKVIPNLNSSATMLAENATLLPIETLRKLNLNGQLLIDDLKVNNLTMQGIRLILNAKNGTVQSLQSVNRFYQGAYNGKIALDITHELPILTLQQQLSHIQIEPLFTDLHGQSRFSGLVDLNAKLEASGNTTTALKSSLNGRLSFLAKELLIRGFNLQQVLDNGKIWLSNPTLPSDNKKDRTVFSNVNSTAIISNGFLRNNDLSATASKTKLGGMGVINLVSQQLDYKIIALLSKEKLTAAHAKVINNIPVFINITGTFDNPAYQIDLAAMGVGL